MPADAFRNTVAPDLVHLARRFPGRLGYFARHLHPDHLAPLVSGAAPWAGLGFDSRWDLAGCLRRRTTTGFVQGNFDPALLSLEGRGLDRTIDEFLDPLRALSWTERRGWICGLGHGVLPGTPESSVRRFVQRVRSTLQ